MRDFAKLLSRILAGEPIDELLPPIAGGAAGPILVTSAVAIGPVATSPAVAMAISDPKNGPGSIAFAFVPQVLAVTSLATVTLQIVRTDISSSIGQAIATNGAASTQPIGPMLCLAPVPAMAAGATLALQYLGSAAAGNLSPGAGVIAFGQIDLASVAQ